MNKIFISTVAILLLPNINLFAQEPSTVSDTVGAPFNRWAIEASLGPNKAVKPFAEGYFSSNGAKFFNFSKINHFDIGARYMLSNKFGLKLDFASDNVANQKGSGSLPFDVDQYRAGIQGVANLGRIMGFEQFTGRVGLLVHAGIQAAYVEVQQGANKGLHEYNGGIMFGLTPQLRLSRRLALTADFTVLSNVRQHLTWDGSVSAQDNNLTGQLYNISMGLSFYPGKKEVHADWYYGQETTEEEVSLQAQQQESRKRLDDLESMLADTDRDGVPDYLDVQNNTPNGVAVDAKGRFLDQNGNGTPDEMEPRSRDGRDGKTTSTAQLATEKSDALRELVAGGYLNVFYSLNSDTPNSGSANNIYHIIRFMKTFPDTKAVLTGYADSKGNEQANKELSRRRAAKLLETITASGISHSRISIAGEGTDTSFSNSQTGRQLARRVSITLQ
jgi:OmpA-OmpF porin, OOP family